MKNEVAKISDFGVSKIIDAPRTWGDMPFPWRWTAPEVKEERAGRGNIAVSSKADVFSFGGLIYECLQYGEVPFRRRTINTDGTVGRGDLAGKVRIYLTIENKIEFSCIEV